MSDLDHLLDALRETVPADDDFQRQALAAARRTFIARMPRPPRRRFRFSWPPSRSLLIAALSLAFAAIAILVPTSGGTGHRGGNRLLSIGVAPASAKAVLLQAARTSSRRAWHPLSDHEWLYYHFEAAYPGRSGRASRRASFSEDAWLASDGGARVVQYTDRDVLLIGSAAADLAAERAFQRRTSHFRVATAASPWPPSFTYRQVVGLPTRVRALREWIARAAARRGERGSRNVLAFLQGLVIDPRVPPKVAAALYSIISQLADVTMLGKVRDPLGRVGPAVGFSISLDTQTQLIFDRRTGRVLAIRQVALGRQPGDPPRGALESWEALSGVTVVRSDHRVPHSQDGSASGLA